MTPELQAEVLKYRVEELLKRRQAARTDLLYLCNKILGYVDVSRKVHGEIIDHLQHFVGGEETVDGRGNAHYKPAKEMWQLEGNRNRLVVFPRGHLKTTVITIAHTIQWMLNYPDIRIALSMAIGDQTKKVMSEIQNHFKYNGTFRFIFPDFCPPPKKAADWGNQDEFTIPARKKHRKEPSLCLITVGKVIAGSHYDVVKHSDLVDEVNAKTPGGLADVARHFGAMNPLIERYSIAEGEQGTRYGFQDLEGTFYDFGDLNMKIAGGADSVAALRDDPPAMVNGWHCLVRGARKKDGTSIWMDRFPPSELERIEKLPEISPQQFSSQWLSQPIPPEGGLCDAKDIVFLSRQVISDLLPRLRVHCTIDLHGLEPAKNDNDYTVLTVGGFDRDGRLYILDVRRGRFTPDQVIWHVFDVYGRWNPIDFKIEKDAHARVLLPFLQREASKRQRFPTMVPIRRDTHVSKQQRIRGLQPWFRAGIIRFADDLACKTDLILEVMQFPSQSRGVHDDILDTLADQMQNQEGGVTDDVVADPPDMGLAIFGTQKPADRFLGFGEEGVANWLYGSDDRQKVYSPTGIM